VIFKAYGNSYLFIKIKTITPAMITMRRRTTPAMTPIRISVINY
jgi:hypothetical protein